MDKEKFMSMAIVLSMENIKSGKGGPFGAVIVKDGKIIGQGTNSVTLSNDPTAHAEVNAIREACKNLGSYQLEGCEIYTSCEPCPMCLGAIYWSRISKVFYANTKKDAAEINFDDDFIYDEIAKPIHQRTKEFIQLSRSEALGAFEEWRNSEDKTPY